MEKYILLFIIAAAPVSAGIYKWTDNDGNVHFGDQPDNPGTATELNIQINNKAGVTNSSGNKKERDYLLKKIEENKVADTENREKKAEEGKKRRALCSSYRSRLQGYMQSGRTFTISPDGERTYLSDEQRASRKKELSKGVAKYCR